MLDDGAVQRLAEELDQALLEKRELQPLEKTHGPFSLDDAYRVQSSGVTRRAARGERPCGFKMGLTSEAKRRQMKLGSPVFGVLTDKMALGDGEKLPVESGIHPKAEPEIFFVTARELRGPVSLEQAAAAVAQVGAALEVLDSRYQGFQYFSLPDVVADNASSWRYVLSSKTRALGELQLDRVRMQLFVDGQLSQEAPGSAISGHPLLSLVQLCELLAAQGRALPAGSLVLAGAATAAVQLKPGMEVRLEVEGLFPVSLRAR
jgi:2-oxo-3-hexenedioate decarboxylase